MPGQAGWPSGDKIFVKNGNLGSIFTVFNGTNFATGNPWYNTMFPAYPIPDFAVPWTPTRFSEGVENACDSGSLTPNQIDTWVINLPYTGHASAGNPAPSRSTLQTQTAITSSFSQIQQGSTFISDARVYAGYVGAGGVPGEASGSQGYYNATAGVVGTPGSKFS